MKKRFTAWLMVYLMLAFTASPALAGDVREAMTYFRPITINDRTIFKEISAPAGNPSTNTGWLYAKDAAGTTKLYFEDSTGTVTDLITAAGGDTLDSAYDQGGAGVGRTITVDQGAVQLNGSHATNDTFFVNKTAGTGDAIQVTNAGTGYDINGTSGTWFITKAGLATLTGLTTTGAAVNVNAGSNFATNINTGSSTGTVSIGGGTNSVGINSSTWDISTAGAISGVSTIAVSDDITAATTKGLKSTTTDTQTVVLKAYDVDNTTYRDVVTLTNANTITAAIGTGNETLAIDTTTWDVSTLGAFTGVADITGTAGEAMTITLASDGAADDLTISVTGANDASVILASAGTGEDAIKLSATAGGVDIDGAAAKNVTIDGGQVLISSKDDAASAIALTANIGTSETIVVTNTQGTGEGAITLTSTAGGIDMNAAATKNITLDAGQILVTSTQDTASAFSVTTNTGTSETIVLTNTQGTSESAITLTSTAGGVNVDAAAAKDLDLAGGQVKLVSKDDAAGAISLTANVGTSETITITNTQGNTAAAITLTATAGGINLVASSGITTGDAITGDGTAALSGFLDAVENDNNGKVLAATDCGTVQVCTGAGVWDLPEASTVIGCRITFVVGAVANCDLNPEAADQIMILTNAAGDAIRADAIGETITVLAIDGTQWVSVGTPYGTWTDVN